MVLPKWAMPLAGFAMVSFVSVACTPAQQPGTFNDRQNNALNQEQSSRYISNPNGMNGNGFVPRSDTARVGRGQNEIGFIRYNKANNNNRDNGGGMQGPDVYIDRNALANHIGYLVTAYPQINDAIVLVTDDHVFVGVNETNGASVDRKTAEDVHRTASSVTPRYYEVTVTDDDYLRQRITAIGDKLSRGGNLDDYRDDVSEMLRNMGDDTPPRPLGDRHRDGTRTKVPAR